MSIKFVATSIQGNRKLYWNQEERKWVENAKEAHGYDHYDEATSAIEKEIALPGIYQVDRIYVIK